MANLRDAFQRVRTTSSALDAARADLAAAQAELVRLQRARLDAARVVDPRRSDPTAQVRDLDSAIERATAAVAGLREKIADARADVLAATGQLGALADPPRVIGQLDARTPLLLMPLRIETRFKKDELWVRIYPDQWAVDTFEDRLTDTEVVDATRFWASLFRAGGDEGLRRAAWRTLVATAGSGRAGWIIEQFAPKNPEDEPERSGADEVILVVAGPLELTAPERAAAATYWEDVWRAGGDPDGSFAATLRGAVGDAMTGAIVALRPQTLAERPAGVDPATADVTVAFCVLPEVDPADVGVSSWTRAARADVLPDRIVLLGFQGARQVVHVVGEPVPPSLVVGPDPAAGPGDQFRIEDGKLVVPDELRWMVDFEAAVEVGMAMRVTLAPELRSGLDRLFAVGIRAGATPEDDQATLEALLTRHHRSRLGISLVTQGTPTNNTEGVPSGFDRLDDAELSYHRYLGTGSDLTDRPEWAAKQDGQWLAECLGIDPAVLGAVAGATGTDQAEARAMNTALWPATWGYFLETMMHPVLVDRQVEQVRAFFVDYVSGRGRVPTLRIGRQPYGIVPTTALDRLRFGTGQQPADPSAVPDLPVLTAIQRLLTAASDDVAKLAAAVPHAAGGDDPHQTLLDVVALHPASVEFHQRYAESVVDIFNRFRLDNLGDELAGAWDALGSVAAGRQLLARLGYTGTESPDILAKVFHAAQHRLTGPVIDDRPLSETAGVRAYCDDGRNYLHWLTDAGRSSLEELRRERGFTGDQEPTALLYVLLRHALLLSWWDAATRVRLDAGLIERADFAAARREPAFVHVSAGPATESRWSALYDPAAAITGDDQVPLHQAIPGLLGSGPTRHLDEVVGAIGALADLPTARLERLLAEHLDCCSHRFDAWQLALVTRRLLDLRGVSPRAGSDGQPPAPRRGVHLGAYGWLHDVRPETHDLEPVELTDELAVSFGDPAEPPVLRDPSNAGFVHAPSLNHATTAAILRSGFLANAAPAHPDAMAVNLSSERMRLAMSVLQGLRTGQPLGALLGYRFERGLHDRHALAEVDSFIRPLRLLFPSPGDRDGRLTVDGLELARHLAVPVNRHYPFNLPGLPLALGPQRLALDLEVERLLDVHDAVADLVLAEGVHQAVLGNVDRVAATLDAVGRAGFPPEPAVLETPQSGITLTHRVGVHLRTGLDHLRSPVTGMAMTPRAMAEPAVNELLTSLLPDPALVVARVRWHDPDGADRDRLVTQVQLGLQPIDLLHLVRLEVDPALGELDERIVRLVADEERLRPDVSPLVHFTEQVPGFFTFFEIAPLVGHLRTLLTGSRPLRASDVVRAGDATTALDDAVHADRARPAAVASALDAHHTSTRDLADEIDRLLADPVAARATIVAGTDDLVDRACDLLAAAGRFGVAASGWGQLAETRRSVFVDLLSEVATRTGRWQVRLTRAGAALAHDTALPSTATDEERIAVLTLADGEVRPSPTSPVPTDADAYRSAIEAQRDAFAALVVDFAAVAGATTSLTDCVSRVAALLPVGAFDSEPFPITTVEDRFIELCRQALRLLQATSEQVDSRLTAGAAQLAAHDLEPPGRSRVDALAAAVTAMLGPDALFVPEFDIGAPLGDEWEAAVQWRRTGGLLAALTARPFPVDDWMHGVARVRDKVRAWEHVSLLASALGRAEPELVPVQLPHASEPWLAMEWPSTFTLTGERLLYTAHYPAAFDKHSAQAGLLLDEWVEVVPGESATTGVVFNHDSPDSQPPQAMLLVVPPDPAGTWQWDDLVSALHDTLDLAQQRAIEPDALAATAYAAFLPATLSEATLRGLGISANFAVNNGLYKFMRADHA